MDNISKYILSHLGKPTPYMEFLAMVDLLKMMDDDESERLYQTLGKMLDECDGSHLIIYGIEPLDLGTYDWSTITELCERLCALNEKDNKRNKSISELLELAMSGGEDGYDCVMELCDRFPYQSFDDQKRIIKGLLPNAHDCICYSIISDMWGEILIDDIVRMWRREKNMHYNRYIIKYASEDFVWEHIGELSNNCYDYGLLCRRLGNNPNFEIDRKKFRSKWAYYSALKYLGQEIDGEQLLEELFCAIKCYITNPKRAFGLVERELDIRGIKNYISAKLMPDVIAAIEEFNDMGLCDETLFFYEWDATIRRMVNERLDEQYADTQCMPSIEDMWLLYCKIARHNFPEKYAYMVAEDPRCIKRREEMLDELKPFIEQFGFEVEDDEEDIDFYEDESLSPTNDYIITMPSSDEVPF